MNNFLGTLACRFGLHSIRITNKWIPSIMAEIVTDFEQTHKCRRCEKVISHIHWQWDGKDMVDV